MKKLVIAVICLIAGFWQTSEAQGLSNKGKEFWVGYGHNYYFESDNSQSMVLYLSADQPATVTVSITGTTWTRTYNIPANTVVASDFMPKAGADDSRLWSLPTSFGGTNSEGVFNKGIHIVSNVPIVAYAHIYAGSSSGATMLMPVETWGYNYVSVNYTQVYSNTSFTWINVISNHDNTRVQITPSVTTRSGVPAGSTITVTLNKGQVYQVLGALTSANASTGNDLTGSIIKSVANDAGECYPIATFSGSSRTSMSLTCSGSGGDNYIQQVFPSQAWGKRYLTAPTSTSAAANSPMINFYRIVVKDPTTRVTRNGVVLTGLTGNNTYYQYASQTADYITADKPILVAQYMPSSGGCYSGDGDPEMFYISPIEQSIKSVGFYRNNRFGINSNYLTLIIPTAGVNSLLIDGTNTFSHTYPHPNLPGYTVVVRRWTSAQAQCRVTSDSAFTAITYGLGSVESYGYNAGTLINNLNVVGEIRNEYNDQSSSNAYTCKNTPFIPTVLIAYPPTKMVWRFSQVSGITPNADVVDLNPTQIGTQVINGATYYRYRLSQSYQFADTGTFDIPILTTHPSIENCTNTEEVKISITVRTSPATNFSFFNNPSDSSYTGCQLDTVRFLGSAVPVGGGSPVTRFRWTFSTALGDTSISASPTKYYTTPGTYNVKFQGITLEGCVGDTTKAITIYAPPSADFATTPTSACQPAVITATSAAAYGGTAAIKSWYWDFGNSQTSTTATNTPATVTYPNLGTYTVKHVAKISDLCISDTVSKTVTVYAKPQPNFTYPQGCLQPDGSAQFNDASIIADNQAVTYLWNFGDQNATPANPDTSTLKNPIHRYGSYGTYQIKLTVTTVNGCSKDTTISITFSLRPTFAYTPLSSICVNGATVSVAKASVTNSVPGTGTYRGPGTDAAGNFNPSAAGVGTHTIWYIFQTNGGCRDSVSQTVKVFPKPAADFTVSRASICADSTAIITDQSTITNGTIREWHWVYSDGTTATYQNGTAFPKGFANSGSYTIKLFAVSDSSCVSDTISKTLVVNPLPVASFILPASVCMPAGQAQFTNNSTLQGGGPISYTWNFGDNTPTVTTTSPLHVYSASGPYNITLVAQSEAGCKSDTVQTLSTFYDQPIASFSINADILCQGTSNIFTDLSTAPNSQIAIRRWTFGDGTRSTNTNPAKKYIQPGTYTVSLSVESQQGCLSDTFTKTVTVYLQPLINAGRSFIVPEGTTVQFEGIANDTNTVSFLWTPGAELSSDTILQPKLIARRTQTYFLTAKGDGNCTATDSLTVKILKLVQVPNAFSPNGDGINDTWVITNLADYAGATIEVYDRYGHMLIRNTGYARPWDGTLNSKPLPIGTYYYIIDPKNGFSKITGSVTILR